jgi:hypothetical protein
MRPQIAFDVPPETFTLFVGLIVSLFATGFGGGFE